ncbi:MAG TPA: HTH domain-containing protein [Nevskiaceae bacterium]|nr:HTH domain-containing protein [Nevskiaceae bacterium]
MLELLGQRQKELLKLLLQNKAGLTVDELAEALSITRNAVRQHLAALETDGLIKLGPSRPTKGRPEQLYLLADKGKEIFPRQYSWLAQLVIESVREESGSQGLRERLRAMGSRVANQLRAQHPELKSRQEKVVKLSELMEQLGYNTLDPGAKANASAIEADNCVFHDLAHKDPSICEFDLALLSTFTDSAVDNPECMAKGGHVCRFKFGPKAR